MAGWRDVASLLAYAASGLVAILTLLGLLTQRSLIILFIVAVGVLGLIGAEPGSRRR